MNPILDSIDFFDRYNSVFVSFLSVNSLNLKHCFKLKRRQYLGRVLMNHKLVNLCKPEEK